MSEDHEIDHGSQYSLDYATKHGLKVVVPGPRQLQLDIDTDEAYATYEKMYTRLADLGYVCGASQRPSRSKPEGRHVTVNLSFYPTAIERIALQAIMGSDPAREAYSFFRYKSGEAIPTLFYEKRDDTQSKA
jgi:hypothetical protein